MLLHTGVRPYACKFCDKRFILPRRLLAHASGHHGNEGAAWATSFLSGMTLVYFYKSLICAYNSGLAVEV